MPGRSGAVRRKIESLARQRNDHFSVGCSSNDFQYFRPAANTHDLSRSLLLPITGNGEVLAIGSLSLFALFQRNCVMAPQQVIRNCQQLEPLLWSETI